MKLISLVELKFGGYILSKRAYAKYWSDRMLTLGFFLLPKSDFLEEANFQEVLFILRIENILEVNQLNIYDILLRVYIFNLMQNKNYLTLHPQLYKKIPQPKSLSSSKQTKMPQVDIDQMTHTLIQEQANKIKDLQLQISAYQIQISAEKHYRIDHGPYIEAVERQISHIRNQQTYINEQINNCQLVENSVTPMEYYLWKKKQRINTYDASIAEICREIQRERQDIERQIEELHREGQQISLQMEKYEERITQLNSAPQQSFTLDVPQDFREESFEELVMNNSSLKEQYSALANTNQILHENKDIVSMQAIDNVKSIESTIKTYFDGQKARLVKEFKQMQIESKSSEISPLTTEDQNYKIDPLLADYSYKLKELYNSAPEEIKKIIYSILQPLSWQKFSWRDFLEVEPRSEQVYVQYRKLESQYMQNQAQTDKLQDQIKQISHQLVTEQLRSTQLAENIRKLRKTLKK